MAYMRRTAASRKNLREKFPWARSLVCAAARYPTDRPEEGIARRIARYAQGDDYHDTLDGPLKEVELFIQDISEKELGRAAMTRRYIDTGPLMEKSYAAAAGIGWMGKNTLILNEDFGSYLFLAEIVTDIPLAPDAPAAERCGSCTLCLDACPTSAFVSPYVLDATRCISYQTIETKKDIPAELGERLEENLFGCDICQEVCPWNSRKNSGENKFAAAFRTRAAYLSISPENLESMSPDAFLALFRKSPLKRAGLAKLQKTARTIFGPSKQEAPAEEKFPTESQAPRPRSSESRNKP